MKTASFYIRLCVILVVAGLLVLTSVRLSRCSKREPDAMDRIWALMREPTDSNKQQLIALCSANHVPTKEFIAGSLSKIPNSLLKNSP